MPKKKIEVHCHVWEGDEIKEDVDLEHTDTYDDHIQVSGTVAGKHLELRIFFDDLKLMIKEARKQGYKI